MIFGITGCKENTEDVYRQKTYDVNVDYIGENYKPSENVKGVLQYADSKGYDVSGAADTIWIEEDKADADFIKSALNSKKTVIIIAGESADADALAKKFTDKTVKEAPEGELFFEGLLLTEITDSEYDAVGLYCSDRNASQTEFLAFCSEYNYSARYQGNVLMTEIMSDAQVIKNCFNVVNFSEQAYAVMFSTLADYKDNPTGGTDPYRYEYTLMNYAEVICVKGKSSGFNSAVYAGGDGMTVKPCPSEDIAFDSAVNVSVNFLFMRNFKTVFNTDYSGVIKPVIKGRDSLMEWRIACTDKKKNEIKSYNSKNFTGAADCVNTDGIYTPSFEVSFSTENDGVSSDWRLRISMNEKSAKTD